MLWGPMIRNSIRAWKSLAFLGKKVIETIFQILSKNGKHLLTKMGAGEMVQFTKCLLYRQWGPEFGPQNPCQKDRHGSTWLWFQPWTHGEKRISGACWPTSFVRSVKDHISKNQVDSSWGMTRLACGPCTHACGCTHTHTHRHNIYIIAKTKQCLLHLWGGHGITDLRVSHRPWQNSFPFWNYTEAVWLLSPVPRTRLS